MKLPRASESDDLAINLAPLIDVIFILLIFFVLTTSFVRENRIGIILPDAQSTSQAAEDSLQVIIDADGNYIIADRKLLRATRATIRTELQRNLTPNSDTNLEITADARVEHSKVVTLMDIAGELGVGNIRITTREIQNR